MTVATSVGHEALKRIAQPEDIGDAIVFSRLRRALGAYRGHAARRRRLEALSTILHLYITCYITSMDLGELSSWQRMTEDVGKTLGNLPSVRGSNASASVFANADRQVLLAHATSRPSGIAFPGPRSTGSIGP